MVSDQSQCVSQRVLQLCYGASVTETVLYKIYTAFDGVYPLFVLEWDSHFLERHKQRVFDLHTGVHVPLDLVVVPFHLVEVKTRDTPFEQIFGSDTGRRRGQVVRRQIETGTEFMGDTFFRVVIVEEGVNVEVMLFAPHVRQR